MLNIRNLRISASVNIRQALKAMDLGGVGFVAVEDMTENVIGILTDGDFRRAILNGISLEENVLVIANKSFKYVSQESSEKDIIELFKQSKILHLPVIAEGKLSDLLLRKDYQAGLLKNIQSSLGLPVIIMAGGKGTRLAPFTDILPKPLIPLGNKTIIEIIISEFMKYGIKNYFISVNYKAKLIKAFFEDIYTDCKIEFVDEEKPLGTGGALKLLDGRFEGSFFVSNCDIIIKEDYSQIYQFHTDNKFDVTIVGSVQHYQVPYGICELNERGELIDIVEKPEYDFLVNTGMYVLESHTLKMIPENSFYHITQLIDEIKKSGGKVGVYPVSEKSWIDIGQWKEYNNARDLFDDYIMKR